MIGALRRVVAFTRFAWGEYTQSGRVFVEIFASIAVIWLVFWPRGSTGLDIEKFFSLGGSFMLGLAIYTTSSMMSLGNRPQGYIVLCRRLGRRGYLLGLYGAAMLVLMATYAIFAVLVHVAFFSLGLPGLNLRDWLLGSLPLLLNIGVISAFMTLLSSLVITTGYHVLLLIWLALSLTNDTFMTNVGDYFSALRTFLAMPLIPAMKGFELSIQRDFGSDSIVVLIGQIMLMISVLLFALESFNRRELILSA